MSKLGVERFIGQGFLRKFQVGGLVIIHKRNEPNLARGQLAM
jgi:hypothetical protein